MGYAYTGNALLKTSFEVLVPSPLDNRTVVNSEQELYTIPSSSAYRGMTVANPDDGNIYMLTDKSQITSPSGWKSSGISIITCNQTDYQALLENTNLEDYTPINPELDYLRRDSYYYIPEDETGGTYLTKEWGDSIIELLSNKANIGDFESLNKLISNLTLDLSENYTTTEALLNTYATLELTYSISLTDEKFLTKEEASSTYNTLELFNTLLENLESNYVLKSDLKRPGMEDDDYFFITYNEYNQDRESDTQEFNTQLLKSINIETLGVSILKIEEKEIILGEETIVIEKVTSEAILSTENNNLYLNGNKVAITTEIPVIEVLPLSEYDNISEEDIDPDKYYYTYDDTGDINNGYVTKSYVDNIIVSRSEIHLLIESVVSPLRERVSLLELNLASLLLRVIEWDSE